jgi:protein phosphatase 1 regulatory subunit 11
MAAIQRTGTPRGGQTQVQNPPPTITTRAPRQAVLHLRGAMRQSEELDSDEGGSESRSRRRIQWAEDVIDNEGLGRKKSKGLRLPPLKLHSTTQGSVS